MLLSPELSKKKVASYERNSGTAYARNTGICGYGHYGPDADSFSCSSVYYRKVSAWCVCCMEHDKDVGQTRKKQAMIAILDVGTGLVSGGFLLYLIYETIAFFSGKAPTITGIVRPWITQHRIVGTTIAALVIGAIAWFILHFFLPT